MNYFEKLKTLPVKTKLILISLWILFLFFDYYIFLYNYLKQR
jgi:hypothetical protein